jgi:hypothetical protein
LAGTIDTELNNRIVYNSYSAIADTSYGTQYYSGSDQVFNPVTFPVDAYTIDHGVTSDGSGIVVLINNSNGVASFYSVLLAGLSNGYFPSATYSVSSVSPVPLPGSFSTFLCAMVVMVAIAQCLLRRQTRFPAH